MLARLWLVSRGTGAERVFMSYDLDRLTVLVVDDCNNMQHLLRELLKAFGFRDLHTAKSGVEALEALRGLKPDFIICDYNMSPMNGVEFIRTLRNDEKNLNRFVPIIMLTGHAKMSNILAARDAGATEFLAKPVSPQSLYKRIETIIELPRDFVETPSFFGPDRRRSTVAEWAGIDKRDMEFLD